MKIKLELFGVCREFSEQDYLDFNFETDIKIKDLRKDKRVEFISGELPIKNITNKVKNTPNSVAFCLFPHDIDEIIKIVSDNLMVDQYVSENYPLTSL